MEYIKTFLEDMYTMAIILNGAGVGGSFVDIISKSRFLFYTSISKTAEQAFLW